MSSELRDCMNGAPRRRWLWPALAVPLVALGVATGAAALAGPRYEELDDPYARLLAEAKAEEQGAREEIADAVRSAGSEDQLAVRLGRIADAHRLAGEATRRAFVKAVDGMDDSSLRARMLKKLMAAAPITAETGHAILAAAIRCDEPDLARVLAYFHQIQESDLVRGPLVDDYLDATELLRSDEALSEALTGLLHPEELDTDAVLRALKLGERVRSDEGRLRFLREVTDHQQLTAAVIRQYRALMDGLQDPDARELAADRLDDADTDGQVVLRQVDRYPERLDGGFKGRLRALEQRLNDLRQRLQERFAEEA